MSVVVVSFATRRDAMRTRELEEREEELGRVGSLYVDGCVCYGITKNFVLYLCISRLYRSWNRKTRRQLTILTFFMVGIRSCDGIESCSGVQCGARLSAVPLYGRREGSRYCSPPATL